MAVAPLRAGPSCGLPGQAPKRQRWVKIQPAKSSQAGQNSTGVDSLAQARASAHPEQADKTVWQVFQAERASLIDYCGPFDGFREIEVAVSKSSLVRFDHNRYSVAVKAARRTAQLRVYADRVVVWSYGRSWVTE